MRVYADTSFLVKLLSSEADSEVATAQYRKLGLPPLFFLPLHALEVRNAIFQRAFHQRSSGERQEITRERDSALARLQHYLSRRALVEVALDMELPLSRAAELSLLHTERIGTRAIDLLHVACALTLESELFLTTDARQSRLAKAEKLKVVSLV
jgi:predicted nucleic acid-binding protein